MCVVWLLHQLLNCVLMNDEVVSYVFRRLLTIDLGSSSCDMIQPKNLEDVLLNYQKIVRLLPSLSYHPVILQYDLAEFQRD